MNYHCRARWSNPDEVIYSASDMHRTKKSFTLKGSLNLFIYLLYKTIWIAKKQYPPHTESEEFLRNEFKLCMVVCKLHHNHLKMRLPRLVEKWSSSTSFVQILSLCLLVNFWWVCSKPNLIEAACYHRSCWSPFLDFHGHWRMGRMFHSCQFQCVPRAQPHGNNNKMQRNLQS